MVLLKELLIGPSGLSSVAIVADEGGYRSAQNKADKKKLKAKKKMRRKLFNMTHKNKKITEDAAGGATVTGAHNIAGHRGSFFDPVDKRKLKAQRQRLLDKIGYKFIEEASSRIDALTKETDFNPSDVISKLNAAEKQSEFEKDTVAFGLEDENKNIVKVYVPADQADEFEVALGIALAGDDENDDDDNTSLEIAEVLFDLKDKFDIVGVEWGDIPEDEEEQEINPEGGNESEIDNDEIEKDSEDLEKDSEEINDEMTDNDSGASDNDEAMSTLQQVVNILKADAEAKTAEANAKKAEANAEEAKYAAQSSVAKVRQEEEILDMEDAEDNKKKEDQEAKTLAKLAKFQHEKNKGVSEDMESEEEEASEEGTEADDAISQEKLAELIFQHLRAQH